MAASRFFRYFIYLLFAIFIIWAYNEISLFYSISKSDIHLRELNESINKRTLNDKRDSAFYIKVNELIKLKQYDKVINILKDSLKSMSANSLIRDKKSLLLVDIGDVYRAKGEVNQAFKFYGEAIAMDSINITARVRHGEINFLWNKLDDAIVDYEYAATNNYDYYYFLGILQAKTGHKKEAIASLDSCLKYYPKSKGCKLKIDSLKSQN